MSDMISRSYHNPDLTGELEECRHSGDLRQIFQADQVIEFASPVYYHNLELTKIGEVPLKLEEAQNDWEVVEWDIDVTSQLLIRDPSFDKKLVKKIKITIGFTEPYRLNMAYNGIYPVDPRATIYDNQRLDLTPEMIIALSNKLEEVDRKASPITDIHTSSDLKPLLLDIDLTGEDPKNRITNEIHNVSTLGENRKNVVVLHAGSFYVDSLIITQDGHTEKFVEGVDYTVIRENLPKVATTSNKSSIADAIVFVKPDLVNDVLITYQAYGGDITIYDVVTLDKKISNIHAYLDKSSFVTQASIGDTPLLRAMIEQQNNMENQMRMLLQSPGSVPGYGDSTNGTTVVKRVQASNKDVHWYDVAFLYRVENSDVNVTADRMHFRIAMVESHILADVFVTYNKDNTTDPFTLETIAVNIPGGYTEFTDYSKVEDVVRPKFRIIYNEAANNYSGVVLQLGIRTVALSDTIAISDLSGIESCWQLYPSVNGVIPPNDDAIQLPNPEHQWKASITEVSKQIVKMMPVPNGYLACGGVTAVEPQNINSVINFGDLLINPAELPFDMVKSIRIEYKSRVGEDLHEYTREAICYPTVKDNKLTFEFRDGCWIEFTVDAESGFTGIVQSLDENVQLEVFHFFFNV